MTKIVGNGNKPNKVESSNPNPKVDLGKSKPVVCGECGYDIFVDGAKFRKISKLVTGTPQDVIVPMEIFLCGSCGEPVEELQSDQMKALTELDNSRNQTK